MEKLYRILQTRVDFESLNQVKGLIDSQGRGFVVEVGVDQLREWAEKGWSWIVNDENNRVVGHVVVVPCGDKVWELRTCVAENGWGKKLLDRVQEIYEESYKQGEFLAVVREANKDGLEFFLENGYKEVYFEKVKRLAEDSYFDGRDLDNRRVLMRSWQPIAK